MKKENFSSPKKKTAASTSGVTVLKKPERQSSETIKLSMTALMWPMALDDIKLSTLKTGAEPEIKSAKDAFKQLLLISQNLHKDVSQWSSNHAKMLTIVSKWAEPLSKLKINIEWDETLGIKKKTDTTDTESLPAHKKAIVALSKPYRSSKSSAKPYNAMGALDAFLYLQSELSQIDEYEEGEPENLKKNKWHVSNLSATIDAICQRPESLKLKDHVHAAKMGEALLTIPRVGSMLTAPMMKVFHKDPETTVKCFLDSIQKCNFYTVEKRRSAC